MKPGKKGRKALILLIDLLIVCVCTAADQFTKQLAAGSLRGRPPFVILEDILVFQYLENRGAAFGVMQNGRIFFICVGVLFVAAVCVYLFLLPASRRYRPLRFFLCLIMAGALGNMADRISLNYVVDFIYLVCINFPIFNVADIYVTVSCAALVIMMIFVYKEDELDILKSRSVQGGENGPDNRPENGPDDGSDDRSENGPDNRPDKGPDEAP